MERILGIDTGTNSLGWAVIEKDGDNRHLLYKGTNIFSEGVKIEKGIESSKASERTEHRSIRKHYWRRKVRKVRLLTILIENRLCPPLSKEDLRQWKLKKQYPKSEEFMDWQRTYDTEGVNPYRFRYICLTRKLDLTDISQRYILGRALYHLNQRRGFLSNRKETTKESEGTVKQDIDELTKCIAEEGCHYLGEYFYHLYERGEKIRNHYTSRKEHYLKEFHAICERQELDDELVAKLERARFFQRPLKSQKGTVGKCTFEKGKTRCPASHPLYEEFRMYQFINNVKIQTPTDNNLRRLTAEEVAKIIPLFMHKSFELKTIAKTLSGGRNNFCYFKDKEDKPYKFNYQMDTSISGCPVNAGLMDIFGDNWLDGVCEVYTLAHGKTRFQIMNDIWHALFSFDDEEKLKEFAKSRLQLNDEQAKKFCKIPMTNDYASLSLKAIRKILPYMKDYGLIYSQAVFLGNLEEIIPSHIWGIRETREAAIDNIISVIENNEDNSDGATLEQCVNGYIKERYQLSDAVLKKMYHPSMIELYPRVRPNEDGIYQLGSPRISSVKNPMAMHSLFRLRKVVNLLLKKGYIDENTKIHIEFSRDLNDANMRNAIQRMNRENEKDKEKCRKEIKQLYKEACGKDIEPTDTDILKYQLWEEQNHRCLYTQDQIGICDFLGDDPKYDIEHTIPRSVGGDSTKENLTLCSRRFNRDVKKTKLPSQLAEHEEILARIELLGWKEKYEELDKRIRGLRKRPAATKEAKDRNIRERHYLELQRNYWRGKYKRFTMTEVPEGFSRRQGTDISVISRYARMYLKSVFKQVYIVKGIATSDFRKIWGIQNVYEKKKRDNHVHHCIDAITIACIDKDEYDKLAEYYHDEENHRWYGHDKADYKKPWGTFVEDIKRIQDELLIAHYSKDTMRKQAKRNIRGRNGNILHDSNGNKLQMRGDAARASLHNDTYYGAIKRDGEIKYVVRKSLDSLDEKDVKNIVDNEVRAIVENAILQQGSLKKAVEATIWMNEEKQIPIKKVRIFTGSVTRPLHIRQHRDVSRKDYKQQYHVMNDRNYMMAIYVGTNEKGKEKRDFELISNLVAADFYKKSNDKTPTGNGMIPFSKNGLDIRYQLKIGTMVLLYETSPDEVWDLDKNNLQRRLYKVTGLSSMVIQGKYNYGTIGLVHHQDARPSTEIKLINGEFNQSEDFRPGIKLLHSQFKALVEGVDFEINDLGEILRLI